MISVQVAPFRQGLLSAHHDEAVTERYILSSIDQYSKNYSTFFFILSVSLTILVNRYLYTISQDITEILLKVALNTITLEQSYMLRCLFRHRQKKNCFPSVFIPNAKWSSHCPMILHNNTIDYNFQTPVKYAKYLKKESRCNWTWKKICPKLQEKEWYNESATNSVSLMFPPRGSRQ